MAAKKVCCADCNASLTKNRYALKNKFYCVTCWENMYRRGGHDNLYYCANAIRARMYSRKRCVVKPIHEVMRPPAR